MRSKLMSNKGPAGDCGFNMTSMIDAMFLLFFFFILTRQVASVSLATIELPEPKGSVAAERPKTPNNVIINVVSKYNPHEKGDTANVAIAWQASHYSIDGTTIQLGDQASLLREINSRRKYAKELELSAEEFFIEVRADKKLAFDQVRPVLVAGAMAGVKKMHITALKGGA